jgi:hypothetical protein
MDLRPPRDRIVGMNPGARALTGATLLSAAALVMATCVFAQSGVGETERFSSDGITFTCPSSWYVTTRPLSNGLEPIYRFAVGNFRFHRTKRDIGPCLQGISEQRPGTGVLAFMREAIGADARRAHVGARPKAFRLPSPTEQAACLGPGSTQFTFSQAGRVFYLWLSISPKAPPAARAEIRRLLDSMRIAKV